MPNLLIRDIEPALKHRLEESAQKNNRTLSDEAKLLIRRALAIGTDNRKLGTEMFSAVRPEDRGDDLVFKIPGEISKPPEFR